MKMLMEMFSLVFSVHRFRNSSRMTKIIMPVCTPHTDGRNFLRFPSGIPKLPPLHIYVCLQYPSHPTLNWTQARIIPVVQRYWTLTWQLSVIIVATGSMSAVKVLAKVHTTDCAWKHPFLGLVWFAPKQTSHIAQQIPWLLSLLQIIFPYCQVKLLQH